MGGFDIDASGSASELYRSVLGRPPPAAEEPCLRPFGNEMPVQAVPVGFGHEQRPKSIRDAFEAPTLFKVTGNAFRNVSIRPCGRNGETGSHMHMPESASRPPEDRHLNLRRLITKTMWPRPKANGVRRGPVLYVLYVPEVPIILEVAWGKGLSSNFLALFRLYWLELRLQWLTLRLQWLDVDMNVGNPSRQSDKISLTQSELLRHNANMLFTEKRRGRWLRDGCRDQMVLKAG